MPYQIVEMARMCVKSLSRCLSHCRCEESKYCGFVVATKAPCICPCGGVKASKPTQICCAMRGCSECDQLPRRVKVELLSVQRV